MSTVHSNKNGREDHQGAIEYVASGALDNKDVSNSVQFVRETDFSECFSNGDRRGIPHVTLDIGHGHHGKLLSIDDAARFALNKAQRVIDDYHNNFLDLTEDGNDSKLVVSETTITVSPESILLALMSPQKRGKTDTSVLYTKQLLQHCSSSQAQSNYSAPRSRVLYGIRKFGTSLLIHPRDFCELVCWEKDHSSDVYWYASHSITDVPHTHGLHRGKVRIMGMKLERTDVHRRSFLHEQVLTGTKVTAILSIDPNIWMPRFRFNSHMKSLLDKFFQNCQRLWGQVDKSKSSARAHEEEIRENLYFEENVMTATGSSHRRSSKVHVLHKPATTNKSAKGTANELDTKPSLIQKVTSVFLTQRKEKPLTELLHVLKEACDILSPLVQRIYDNLNDENTKIKKAGMTQFTIADGLVQHMLTAYLLREDLFEAVIGEEDSSYVNTLARPYTVDSLQVPYIYNDDIDYIRRQMTFLSAKLEGVPLYRDCTIFIDPIDGTKPFVENFGEHCTILIGVAIGGEAVAGLIYRPVRLDMDGVRAGDDIRFWVAGCKCENTAIGNLDVNGISKATLNVRTSEAPGFITSPRNISPFTHALIEDLCMERIKSGSVGNKVMCLLEGKATTYIQDAGTSRWDTCAPQAVMEAYGGVFCKLSTFINVDGEISTYSYKKSGKGEVNTDVDILTSKDNKFELDLSFSRFNTTEKSLWKERITEDNLHMLKPYSNICGFVCLPANQMDAIPHYVESMKKAVAKASPVFN
uniref:3'(2'),5'-bisphosphate nucleotidase n=1 Tax=Aplanochytrium stocchinoi TaxID=215587 RepID=A0A7S3PM57_9STRA